MPIERLIVIAGPKSVGKSHLIKCLNRKAVPELAGALRIGDPRSWKFTAAQKFENEDRRADARNSTIEYLALHYEFTRPWNRRYEFGHSHDKPLTILELAREITFLTLHAPCDVLLSRYLARNPRFQSRREWIRAACEHALQLKRFDRDFRPLYRNRVDLLAAYANWFDFCQAFAPKRHLLVDTRDGLFSTTLVEDRPGDSIARICQERVAAEI